MIQVTDWIEHYRKVSAKIATAGMPARIRLGVERYLEPIGPTDRAKPVKLYRAPIGPRFGVKFQTIRDEELTAAGVTLGQFMGCCRMKYLAAVRRKIWVRASKETNLSIANIGRLSGRDHTTIIAAIRRAVELETGIPDARFEQNRARARLQWRPRAERKSKDEAVT